jgi:hypothetical protein
VEQAGGRACRRSCGPWSPPAPDSRRHPSSCTCPSGARPERAPVQDHRRGLGVVARRRPAPDLPVDRGPKRRGCPAFSAAARRTSRCDEGRRAFGTSRAKRPTSRARGERSWPHQRLFLAAHVRRVPLAGRRHARGLDGPPVITGSRVRVRSRHRVTEAAPGAISASELGPSSSWRAATRWRPSPGRRSMHPAASPTGRRRQVERARAPAGRALGNDGVRAP